MLDAGLVEEYAMYSLVEEVSNNMRWWDASLVGEHAMCSPVEEVYVCTLASWRSTLGKASWRKRMATM